MNNIHFKKLIGTSVLGLSIGAVLIATATFANAQFLKSRNSIILDGIVTSSSDDSLTIDTNGSEPFTFAITDETLFAGEDDTPDTGDTVRVIARKTDGDNYEARIVRVENDHTYGSYGTAGDNVLVTKGTIESKSTESFTVVNGANVPITFRITPDTNFTNTNYVFLNVGDAVKVFGQDTGSDFIAENVILDD